MGKRKNTERLSKEQLYARDKLRILYRDFCIHITEDDKNHLYSLKSEIEIDRAIRKIIIERL